MKKRTEKKGFIRFAAATAIALAMVLFAAASFPAVSYAIDGPKNGKLLFSYDDDRFDDYGPGYYSYPDGKLYKSNRKMFDIKCFKMYEVEGFYRFDVEYSGKIVRSWPGFSGQRNGWILNIAEIYIDMDHRWGSGHKSAILGRNVTFYPENHWEKVVFVSPMSTEFVRDAIRQKTDSLEFVDMLSDFVFPVNINVYDYTLSAMVRKSELGEYNSGWGFQVLSTIHDDTSSYLTFYNRQIFKSVTEDNFGGGTDFFGAPNLLDMLVPKGKSQKEILSRYNDHPNFSMAEFAKIPCVYSDEENMKPVLAALAAADPKAAAPKTGGLPENKLDLSIGNEFNVKEKILEISKDKDISAVEKAPQEEKNAKADVAAQTPSKQNKNKSDKNKIDKAQKSGNYDEFLKKLEDKKKKASAADDNSLDDVESFLKKDTKVGSIKTKPVKNEKAGKYEGFDSGVYEMAKIEGNAGSIIGKGNKKKTPAVAEKVVKTQTAQVAKSNIQDAPEPQAEDKSILGRLFKKRKPNKADPAALSEAVKSLDLDESEKTETNDPAAGLKLETQTASLEPRAAAVEKTVAAVVESADGTCGANMKAIRDAALAYITEKPDAGRVSMNTLVSSGKLKELLKCPQGGRYLIEINEGKPEITCINVNGTGHGKLK